MTLPHGAASGPSRWTRYVAIGDSFTEGMCDPSPEPSTGFVGWADRLAGHLSAGAAARGDEFRYANLAVRGRKLEDVVGRQFDVALSMEPHLLSMVGGGNDILRPRVDLELIASRLEDAVAVARAAGVDVLLATPSDPSRSGVFRALKKRHAVHTANLFGIAARHGAYVLDIWQMRSLRDWRMWADDRIHLTSEGHRRVALAALEALGYETDRAEWMTPLPAVERAPRRQAAADHAVWTRQHLTPWVGRRVGRRSSGDMLRAKRPELATVPPDPITGVATEPRRTAAT